MLHVRQLSPDEESRLERRRAPKPKMDLSTYREMLDQMPMERWVGLELEEGESQRAAKRRLTTAAKLRGHRLIYKPGPSERELYAKLTAQEKQRRGPRQKKTEEEPLFGEGEPQGNGESAAETPTSGRSRGRSW